jgi:hypothetical protein
MVVEWRVEGDETVAYIQKISIGAVWCSEATGEHWYGFVEGLGRIGTCASIDDAKRRVEDCWKNQKT